MTLNITLVDLIGYLVNIGLFIWAIYEKMGSAKDKADIKASIRIWQHQAKGISSAIQKIVWSSNSNVSFGFGNFSKTEDVGIALSAIHSVTESMSDSLYESRFFTESEIKDSLKKDKENDDKSFSEYEIAPQKIKKITKSKA